MAKSQVIGTDELLAKFRALGEAAQGENLALATLAGGMVVLDAAKKNVKDQGLMRTRTLSRSLTQEVEEQSPEHVTVAIGTNLVSAKIHEYGGTITPKNGKYLAIPLSKTARAAGSPRKFPLVLHLVKGGSGNLVLVSDEGEAHYVLMKSVYIPAKPYLRPAYDENVAEAQKTIAGVFVGLIEKAVG
jgi:HK97 gp10 family phage protein